MGRMHRGKQSTFGGLAAVVFAVAVGVAPASAATTASWAAWSPLTGSGGAYTSTVTLAGQPALAASLSSDSRAGQVGVISGASTWLAEGTPVGAKYGSSKDQPYLNLRPKADTATAPSTTTYSFDAPTPASGWAFVLGDIDADRVRISAVGADGEALTAAELGFQGGFNYCAPGVTGKPSCTGVASDVPVWDPAALTLTGNAAAADTSGSAAWFEPSTPITSLSFSFTRRAGFPVYQTWFASLARDIAGTVTDLVDGPVDGVALSLLDANGDVVGTTTTAGGGLYAFPGYFATDGYRVVLTPPDGKISDEATAKPADLTEADAAVDFTIRDIVPVAVSGRVTDDGGTPLAGVTVEIDGQTTTTDANGEYLFDSVPVGTRTVTITTPEGYAIVTSPPAFEVPQGSEAPITGVDFVVAANPALEGAVTAAGAGVPGVTVTATGDGGTVSTVTGADGGYRFPALPPGEYVVAVEVPGGYFPVGATSRDETVADDDVTDVDFELARAGSIEGVVRSDGGDPVPGAAITVDGPDGPVALTTGPDGDYAIGTLPPGSYTITVTPLEGTTVVGTATRTVVITEAGEAFAEQDFTLQAAPAPTTPPGPSTPPAAGGSKPAGTLPATGVSDASHAAGWAGLLFVALGAAVIGAVRVRRGIR